MKNLKYIPYVYTFFLCTKENCRKMTIQRLLITIIKSIKKLIKIIIIIIIIIIRGGRRRKIFFTDGLASCVTQCGFQQGTAYKK